MSSEFDDLSEDAALTDRLASMKKSRDGLARQLHEVKHKHSDYLETVWDAVHETIGGITVPKVKRNVNPVKGRIKSGQLVAVALLSDLQTGKITPNYDSAVCAVRVANYADQVIAWGKRMGANHAVVPMLGDMVEGVDIFPGQQWLIDSTLYRQLFDTTPVILADFVRRLLTYFETVSVEAVDGNHGRIGRKGQYGPEDNADRFVYRILDLLLRDEPRATVEMTDPSGERNWYKIMELGNYRAMLIHGDQIRGANGFPWYGLGKKVHGWASGGLCDGETFNDLYMGHYHQAAVVPMNHRTVYANGAVESMNTFAAETLAAQSTPCQWLLFVDPDAGEVASSHIVRLT